MRQFPHVYNRPEEKYKFNKSYSIVNMSHLEAFSLNYIHLIIVLSWSYKKELSITQHIDPSPVCRRFKANASSLQLGRYASRIKINSLFAFKI